VHDFTQSVNPAADLAAARAATPDGRVCGSFRASQIQAPLRLTRRLKWFVVALALIVGQGLTAQEAVAQVRKSTAKPVEEKARIELIRPPSPMPVPEDLKELEPEKPEPISDVFTGYVHIERMPHLRSGGGTKEIVDRIHAQLQWPKQEDGRILQVEGRMFASFTVEADGRISKAKIVRSLHPAFDEAVLQVIRGMTGFTPGQQNGQPVPVGITVPITFKLK